MTTSNNIGYRRPPAHSQFKKGKSGNPAGRPKQIKITNPSHLFIEILSKPISVSIDNKTQTITTLQGLLLSWVKQSMAGRSGATKAVMELIGKLPPEFFEDPMPFRENSESDKLIELFRQRAESYRDGSADVFADARQPEESREDSPRR